MSKIRVLIADDHALVRAGLRALLTVEPGLEVVGEATDGVSVVKECHRSRPDVVLMDLTMPGRGGIVAIEDLRQALPQIKVVAVSMHEDAAFAWAALQAGASGYVLKKALATELIRAIHTVYEGRQHLSREIAAALTQRSVNGARQVEKPREELSAREQEVLRLIALGYTTAEIGSRLHISDKTVESHRKNIAEKLGSRTRADLVRFALEHKLIDA